MPKLAAEGLRERERKEEIEVEGEAKPMFEVSSTTIVTSGYVI